MLATTSNEGVTIKNTKNIGALILLIQVVGFGFSVATADEINSKVKDDFKFSLGAFFITDSETTLRLDSNDLPAGVYVNLERQLGVETQDSVGRIDGYYRFNNRHRLDYGYYPIERRGTRTITAEIPTNPPITAGSTVATEFDTTTYKVGYTYSFYHSNEVELGLGVGLHVTSYKLSIKTQNDREEGDSLTTPLPVLSLLLNYNITPAWQLTYTTQTFLLQSDGNKGALTDTTFSLEYRAFDNVSLGVAYNRVTFNLDFTDQDYLGTVDNSVTGFTTYVALYF